jgi:REP element-mobilizing transposase RayT
MRKRRKFYRGVVNHVYQKSINGVNMFYEWEDYIVFYTIFSVCAKSADVEVLELCIMYNHFHGLIRAESVHDLSSFMDRVTAWFVMEHNTHVGRKGKLLKKNYGSAPKWDDKAVRNAINYIGNNPIEKKLCKRAEEYRWNFLAYAFSRNPFSEPLKKDRASKALRKALKEVDYMAEMNLPIKYNLLARLKKNLPEKEIEQLIDYIIVKYLPFDYQELVSYYESYDTMLTAMHSNTGSEHDIREECEPESDLAYAEMIRYIRQSRPGMVVRRVTTLAEAEKADLAMELQRRTSATYRQICRFLHITSKSSARKTADAQ